MSLTSLTKNGSTALVGKARNRSTRFTFSSATTAVATSATAARSSTRSFALPRVFLWYSTKLDTHPLVTRGLTSGVIAATGDWLCQVLLRTKNDVRDQDFVFGWWDISRSLRFFALGSLYVAPGCHYWFRHLATRYPYTPGTSSAVTTMQRLALDQFVYTPFFLTGFVAALWSLEELGASPTTPVSAKSAPLSSLGGGHDSLETIDTPQIMYLHLRDTLPDLLVANWMLWIPAQAVNFYAVPTKYLVLTSNLVALVWNAYVSFSTTRQSGENQLNESSSSSSSKLLPIEPPVV